MNPLNRLISSLAAVAGILFCFSPLNDATAYSLEGPKWPVGATVTFQDALGNPGRTLLDGNTSWSTAAGFTIWNNSIHLNVVNTANLSAAISRGDHVNS